MLPLVGAMMTGPRVPVVTECPFLLLPLVGAMMTGKEPGAADSVSRLLPLVGAMMTCTRVTPTWTGWACCCPS